MKAGIGHALVLGTVLVLLLAACAAPPPTPAPVTASAPPTAAAATAVPPTVAPPSAPTTIRIAVGADPDNMDPIQTTTVLVTNIEKYVLEPLLRMDKDAKPQAVLATKWDVSSDGLTYTFTLRDGVTFSDGTALDANAVKWNFDRLLDTKVKSTSRQNFGAIKEVQAVDAKTVKVILKEVNATMLGVLSTLLLASPNAVKVEGNSYDAMPKPVGTGPYVFKQRVAGERIEFARNGKFWGEAPYYDSVVIQIVPEAATRESLLLAGQADLILSPPANDVTALKQNSNVKVLLAPSSRTIYIAMNNKSKLFSDVRVRQAMNYAVDRQALIKNVLFDLGTEMAGPMGLKSWADCGLPAYTYDPAKAKKLLADAGAQNLEFDFISPTGRYVQDYPVSQAIQTYLADIGVKANLKTMDWPSYTAAITVPPDKNTLGMHFLGWTPSFPDPSQMMIMFETKSQVPNGLGTSFYSNPDVDKLLDQGKQVTDAKQRNDIYCQASKKIWDDAPIIFLWNQLFPIVYRSNLTNVDYLPSEEFVATYARPAK